MPRLLPLALFALLLAACSVGPDYRRPDLAAPPVWTIDYPSASGAADSAWWELFSDPVLDGLIAGALRENLDLKSAAARIDQYLGQLQTTRAAFFPQISAGGAVARQNDSDATAPLAAGGPYNIYQGTLAASWEIDLWGRIRRADEAARADLLAGEAGRRAVLLTLTANTAGTYLNLRGLDRQLEIARATERTYGESLRIMRLRHQFGAVSQLEVSQVESQYESARQSIPEFEAAVARQEHLLCLLLGRSPEPIPRGRSIDALAVPVIPAGLPAELLTRRPDLLQAEQQLVAANARIGVARANYFPRLTLTGALGTAALHSADLLTGPAELWQLGSELAAPVFTFGAIEGQVRAAEAVRQQALLNYRQAILAAFRETEDALVGTTKGREQLAAQDRQVAALERYAQISRLQYEAGRTAYLQVLDAERSLFSGELARVQTQTAALTSLVDVYRAMGGGWLDQAERLAAPEGAAQ